MSKSTMSTSDEQEAFPDYPTEDFVDAVKQRYNSSVGHAGGKNKVGK